MWKNSNSRFDSSHFYYHLAFGNSNFEFSYARSSRFPKNRKNTHFRQWHPPHMNSFFITRKYWPHGVRRFVVLNNATSNTIPDITISVTSVPYYTPVPTWNNLFRDETMISKIRVATNNPKLIGSPPGFFLLTRTHSIMQWKNILPFRRPLYNIIPRY